MNERRLATLLFSVGFLTSGLLYWFFAFRWSTSDGVLRVVWALAIVAAITGIALDVKHRREDKAADQD